MKGVPNLGNFTENDFNISPRMKQNGSPLNSGRDTATHKSFITKKSPTNIHGKYESVKVFQRSGALNPVLKPNFFKTKKNEGLEVPKPLQIEEKVSFNPLTSEV